MVGDIEGREADHLRLHPIQPQLSDMLGDPRKMVAAVGGDM